MPIWQHLLQMNFVMGSTDAHITTTLDMLNISFWWFTRLTTDRGAVSPENDVQRHGGQDDNEAEELGCPGRFQADLGLHRQAGRFG